MPSASKFTCNIVREELETYRKSTDKLREICESKILTFGDVKVVKLDAYDDEFAFITGAMSEKDFAQAADKVSGVINRIRMGR